ncbi:golgin subfamily A member 7B isoform X1 [Arvicanthis niloticus]|uniref:golgin subfamily A member 7B isoform X1 n=1 Tax=Arvicanthis niloticus TaxID=61156 RepID=UPI00402B36BC
MRKKSGLVSLPPEVTAPGELLTHDAADIWKKGLARYPHSMPTAELKVSLNFWSVAAHWVSPVLLLPAFVVPPYFQPSWNTAKEKRSKGLWKILCSASGIPACGMTSIPSATAVIPLDLLMLLGIVCLLMLHKVHNLQELRRSASLATKVFIQRDYSDGTICQFQTKFPPELDSRIERQLFEETVKTLNGFYAEAEKIGGSSYLEGCLACATAYFIFLCMETHYEKVLKKISRYIQEQNEKVFAPRGLLLTDPVERGMRVIEISIYEDRCSSGSSSSGSSSGSGSSSAGGGGAGAR